MSRCAICPVETWLSYDVDGEQVLLCHRHRQEWERWGALAGLVAFLLRRAERPWTIGDCEAHGGHDWDEERCRKCGGRR